jgi:hypothetical protein
MPKANMNKHMDRGGTKVVIDPKDKKVMVLKNGKVHMVRAGELENQGQEGR